MRKLNRAKKRPKWVLFCLTATRGRASGLLLFPTGSLGDVCSAQVLGGMRRGRPPRATSGHPPGKLPNGRCPQTSQIALISSPRRGTSMGQGWLLASVPGGGHCWGAFWGWELPVQGRQRSPCCHGAFWNTSFSIVTLLRGFFLSFWSFFWSG